ncbi:nitrate/nitrite transporter [Micromonospora sp. NPDC093277]|uniref:MFS transporter n=1 Tax=Micromonospora sp. NPDC093277 TaxID=3364291 RepID=UPI00381246C4
MSATEETTNTGRGGGGGRLLVLSSAGFTLMFAVWLMFGVLGIPIRAELGLTDVQLSWLSSVAILNGAAWRLLGGVLADRLGGRVVFVALLLFTAIPTYLVSQAGSYQALLLYAFLAGFGGNAFSVGVSWVSAWTPQDRQGFALGVFGAGNVGASVTKFIGPTLIAAVPVAGYAGGVIPGGWRFVPFLYAVLLVVMAVAVWLGTPRQDRRPGHGRPLGEMFRPLRQLRVWRFSLYYVVVFGAYVALSAWLPKYYVDVFGLPLYQAALLTALFIFPASLLRPVGGWLSDRFGARRVMYGTFATMAAASLFLAMPYGHIVLYVPERYEADGVREVLPYQLGVLPFTVAVFVVGIAMGIGKAAVFKHIPEYFPNDVGAVGGLVGMLGALGGFALPPLFAYAQAWTGLPQTTFAIIFLLTAAAGLWMHVTVHRMLHDRSPDLARNVEPTPA